MVKLLAVEGGYQDFVLTSTEWTWLALAGGAAVLALIVGAILMRGVIAADKGTTRMQEIAASIQEGAMAYLSRQFKTICVIVVPVAAIVFFTSTRVLRPDGSEALSYV